MTKKLEQRLTITGKAEACSQTVAIKNVSNHTSKTAVARLLWLTKAQS